MDCLKIYPRKLQGRVKLPASKSQAHRAVICAALGAGASQLQGMSLSEDIQATLQGVEALGAISKRRPVGDGLEVEVIGLRRADDRNNWANKFASQSWRLQEPAASPRLPLIDCNESGSTLRFLLPLALIRGQGARFIGRGNLGQRPLQPYLEIFKQQGVQYQVEKTPGLGLDLRVWGSLKPGLWRLRGDVSSQFITGLLLALPLLKGDSQIELTTPLESEGYLAMTLGAMQDFGVAVENHQGYSRLRVPGHQRYQSRSYQLEGDYSQGAFYLVAGMLGSQVGVEGLQANSLQGDRQILHILQKMGAQLVQDGPGVKGRPGAAGTLPGVIDGAQYPDLIPALALLAALTPGTTEIIKVGRLRWKECDRLQAVSQELNRLGACVKEQPAGLLIQGVEKLTGGQVWSHGDHRLAMMLAMAATCCQQPLVLEDYNCVAKSYPEFWNHYQSLGGLTEVCQ